MEKDQLETLPMPILRSMLITEIQQFIDDLILEPSLEKLVIKRNYIKLLLKTLSVKEDIEFDRLVGRYFPSGIHPNY